MSRKIVWGATLVALGAASYAGLTWYLGERAEQHYQRDVAQLRQWLGEGVQVDGRYERGFRVSHARLAVQWTPPADSQATGDTAAPPQPLRLRIDSDLHHGPWALGQLAAAVVRTRFGLDGLDERTRQVLAQASAPTVTTALQWSGASQSRLELPAGELGEKGARLKWEALRYDLALSEDRTHLRGNMQWPSLEMHLEDAPEPDEDGKAPEEAPTRIDMAMRGMQNSFDVRIEDGLWLAAPGTADFRAEQLTMDSEHEGTPRTSLLALRELGGKLTMERRQEFMGWDMDMQARGSVGPMALDALSWQEHAERIDVQALKQVQQGLMAALRTPQKQQGEALSPADEMAWLEPFTRAMPRLLAGLPAYTTKVKATMGGKEGSLEYSLRMTSAPSDELVAQKGWGGALLRHGSLHSVARLPKAWVAQVISAIGDEPISPEDLGTVLGMAHARGFVKLDADHVSSEVRLENGELELNGKAMPLPFMDETDDTDEADDGLDNED